MRQPQKTATRPRDGMKKRNGRPRRWRKDVTYLKPAPKGFVSSPGIGIVNYPRGTQPDTPTIFIGALCADRKDEVFFEKVAREIVRRLNRV